jgi:hypothetical protein
MKSIIQSVLIVIFGIVLSYIGFNYLKFDILNIIKWIVEPHVKVFFGLQYLGYLYIIYSAIWLIILFILRIIVSTEYGLPLLILIIMHLFVFIIGAYIQIFNPLWA